MTTARITRRFIGTLTTSNLALGSAIVTMAAAAAASLWLQSRLLTQNEQMAGELREMQRLLGTLARRGTVDQRGRPAPSSFAGRADEPVVLANLGEHAIGAPQAPVTIVEFTDLECPFCAKFHSTTFPQLKRDYIDTGKVRFVTRDVPLEKLHPLALTAAKASRCAGEQGRFWEMRSQVLANNVALTRAAMTTFAVSLGVEPLKFDRCTDDPSRFAADLDKDRADALSIGVTATPTFVIGRVERGVLRGTRIAGARPYPVFDEQIKRLLASLAR